MKRLITEFIHDQYKNNKLKGYINGSTVSVDLAGFTVMTEKLMKQGVGGAEILSDIINSVFNRAVTTVYLNGGYVTSFAGDSFIAVFPEDHDMHFAKQAAAQIQKYLTTSPGIDISGVLHNINARIGISSGRIYWGIFCGQRQCASVFTGKAVNEAASLQQECTPGKIRTPLKELSVKEVPCEEITPKHIHKYAPSKKVLQHFIPDSVLELSTQGEFRNITSVFISINTKAHPLKIIVPVLSDLALKHGGVLNEIEVGDKGAVSLVVFGAPLALENQVHHALDFAFEFLRHFPKNKIGITKGKVYSGFIGDNKCREEYTSLGSIINLSARIAMAADEGEVHSDSSLKAASFRAYSFKGIGKEVFRGIGSETAVFDIQKAGSTVSETPKKPFFGHRKDLGLLRSSVLKVQSGNNGGVWIVSGPAGIGKSSLITEAIGNCRKTISKVFLLKCNEFQRQGFYPMVEFLNNILDISDDMDQKKKLSQFKKKFPNFINKVLDKENAELVKKNAPFIADVLGISVSSPEFEASPPPVRYKIVYAAFLQILAHLVKYGNALIFLDDIQWIDNESRSLFQAFLEKTQNYPYVFWGAERTSNIGTLLSSKSIVKEKSIHLKALGKTDILEYLSLLFSLPSSEALIAFIIERSGGNPFYIEQLANYLQENDLLAESNGKLEITKTDIAIPAGISDIIIARVDRLEKELRHTIINASVLGLEFSSRVLSLMLNDTVISRSLKEGSDENIWRPFSELKYIFQHALIKDSIYKMQLKKTLKRLHLLAAGSLEKVYKDDLAAHSSTIARHFIEAGVRERSAHYLFMAGIHAKNKYWNEEAIRHFDDSLKYLKSSEKILQASFNKIKIFTMMARFSESEILVTETITFAEENKNYLYLGKLFLELADIAWRTGNYEKAEEHLKIAQRNIEKSDNKEDMGRVQGTLGNIELSRGNYNKAMEHYKQWLEISKKRDDIVSYNNALNNIGIIYSKFGEYDKSYDCHMETLKNAEKTKNRQQQSFAYGNIGVVHFRRGNFTESKKYLLKWLKTAEEIFDYISQLTVLGNIGVIYEKLGDHKTALKYHNRQHDLAVKVGDKKSEATSLGNVGILEWKNGRLKSALKYYQRELELADKAGIQEEYSRCIGNMGLVFRDMGQYSKAKECFIKKLGITQKIKNKNSEAITLGFLGELHLTLDELKKADNFTDRAMKLNSFLDSKMYLGRNLTTKAEISKKRGEIAEAKEFVLRSLEMLKQTNNPESMFRALVLQCELEYGINKNKSMKMFRKLLDDNKEDMKSGLINYTIFNVTNDPKYGNRALSIYKRLSKIRENTQYLDTVKELKHKLRKI
ncbi:tetratricopeptide repeat protein [bacterium]|nr:tetratricopeptide repeat protein [bacterium]